MPHPSRRLRTAAFGMLLTWASLPSVARADPAPLTPERRHSLDQALGLWGMGLLGGEHGAGYTVLPDGDHYRLEVPLGRSIGQTGARLEGDPLTASATALDGGRWAFDHVQQPASIRLIPPAKPDGTAADPISLAQQSVARSGHVVIDPSLASTSSFDSSAEGVVVGLAMGKDAADFKFDRTMSHTAWQPVAGGRVDVSSSTAADGVAYQAPADAFRMTVRHLSSEGHATGFAPQRLADAVRSGLQLLEMAPAAAAALSGSKAPPDPKAAMPQLDAAQRALLHRVLEAMRDAYGGTSQSLTAEGIEFAAHDHRVSLDKLAVSQAFTAPDGHADIRMRIAVDGIASPDIPPGTISDMLPRHVVLAPHFSGLAVGDAFALLSRAVDSDEANIGDLTPDGMAALSRAPVTSGIDELSFDLGPARLTASGSVRTVSPQDVTGSALVKATGLDALIKRAGDDPLLSQGAPVLVFLKGIGQQDGDVVTWKVAFADRKLTVNGTDMSQLVPHPK